MANKLISNVSVPTPIKNKMLWGCVDKNNKFVGLISGKNENEIKENSKFLGYKLFGFPIYY